MLATLSPGGLSGRLSASRATELLRSIRSADAVVIERRHQALDLLADVRRLDRDLVAVRARITEAVAASKTSLTDIFGVGSVTAALVLGHSGDVGRFATRNHYASYNGTAPLEASSGPTKRHRLNPRGNRQLNHALHMAAVTQVGHDTPGRAYYQRKIAEGKSKKEALRRPQASDLRRRVPHPHRRLQPLTIRPGRTPRGDSSIQRGRLEP